MRFNTNQTQWEGFVIDLTREEGARVLEKENLFLHSEVEKLKNLIKNLENIRGKIEDRKDKKVREFFATNIFLSGSRGTGKTSVLLTLREFLKEKKEKEGWQLEILEHIDLSVNYTGIVFYILSHFKEKIEKEFKPTDCCSSVKLEELFDRLVNNFPKFLKCFCNNDCSFLCNEELEILLDQHEISFLKNFYEFIDKILREKTLILILDDIDLIPEPKILLRTILELAVFFNHPKIIIIGAGDLENLKLRLLNALKSINFYNQGDYGEDIEKLYENMVLALIDKIFPITNRVILSKISPHLLEKIKIQKGSGDPKTLKEFLKEHPTFAALDHGYDDYFDEIKYLFTDISLREFVQVLRTINRQIEGIKKERNSIVKVRDIMISRIFKNLYFEDFILNLKTGFDIEVEIVSVADTKGNIQKKKEVKIKYPTASQGESFLKELEEANFEAFVSFLHFVREILFRTKVDYLEGEKSFLSLIYTYNPKLAHLIKLWTWEINLYLKGHIYFYPLVFLVFLLLQGLHKNYRLEEGYIPKLKDLVDSLLSSVTTKEVLYTNLSIILGDTVKSMPGLPKELRNSLILNLDVKSINNYYPIFKFFKGFILITKLGITSTIGNIWITDVYNYVTLAELDIDELTSRSSLQNVDEEISSDVLQILHKNLKKLLQMDSNNINEIPIKPLTINDLDLLSLAYSKGWATRIKKKGLKKFTGDVNYLLPFYTLLTFYLTKENPDKLFSQISIFVKKVNNIVETEKEKENKNAIENTARGRRGKGERKNEGSLKEETLNKIKERILDELNEFLNEKFKRETEQTKEMQGLKTSLLICLPFIIAEEIPSRKREKFISFIIDEFKKRFDQNFEDYLIKELQKLINNAFGIPSNQEFNSQNTENNNTQSSEDK